MTPLEALSAIAAICAIIGGVILRDRQILAKINEIDTNSRDRDTQIAQSSGNSVSNLKDEFVSRREFEIYLKQFEQNFDNMQREQRETNIRIEKLLEFMRQISKS